MPAPSRDLRFKGQHQRSNAFFLLSVFHSEPSFTQAQLGSGVCRDPRFENIPLYRGGYGGQKVYTPYVTVVR